MVTFIRRSHVSRRSPPSHSHPSSARYVSDDLEFVLKSLTPWVIAWLKDLCQFSVSASWPWVRVRGRAIGAAYVGAVLWLLAVIQPSVLRTAEYEPYILFIYG